MCTLSVQSSSANKSVFGRPRGHRNDDNDAGPRSIGPVSFGEKEKQEEEKIKTFFLLLVFNFLFFSVRTHLI